MYPKLNHPMNNSSLDAKCIKTLAPCNDKTKGVTVPAFSRPVNGHVIHHPGLVATRPSGQCADAAFSLDRASEPLEWVAEPPSAFGALGLLLRAPWEFTLVSEIIIRLPSGSDLLGARGSRRLSLVLSRRLRLDLPVTDSALMPLQELVSRAAESFAWVDIFRRDAGPRRRDGIRVTARGGVLPEVRGKPSDVLLKLVVVAAIRPTVVGTNRGSRHSDSAVERFSCVQRWRPPGSGKDAHLVAFCRGRWE